MHTGRCCGPWRRRTRSCFASLWSLCKGSSDRSSRCAKPRAISASHPRPCYSPSHAFRSKADDPCAVRRSAGMFREPGLHCGELESPRMVGQEPWALTIYRTRGNSIRASNRLPGRNSLVSEDGRQFTALVRFFPFGKAEFQSLCTECRRLQAWIRRWSKPRAS